MATSGKIGAREATREHILAVSRDFISQPRLSKFFSLFLPCLSFPQTAGSRNLSSCLGLRAVPLTPLSTVQVGRCIFIPPDTQISTIIISCILNWPEFLFILII